MSNPKEEISIKVNIADVVYPLRVTVDEEETIRKAAKSINERVRTFREDYHISDKINLLSMVALQFASELQQYQDKNWIEDKGIAEEIDQMHNMLNECLSA